MCMGHELLSWFHFRFGLAGVLVGPPRLDVTLPIRSDSDPDPDSNPMWSMDPERPVKVFKKSDQEVKTLGLDPAPELNPFSATAWIRILIQKNYL
jgi:hypothetical protein